MTEEELLLRIQAYGLQEACMMGDIEKEDIPESIQKKWQIAQIMAQGLKQVEDHIMETLKEEIKNVQENQDQSGS